MRHKEQKDWVKEYNNSSDYKKGFMARELFCKWTKEFEKSSGKSSGELLGLIQKFSTIWKQILPSLKPFADDLYFTERAFIEWFYQQIEHINQGLYPKRTIDEYIKILGFDPCETRSNDGADDIIVFEFAEVKRVKTAVVSASFNEKFNKKFRGLYV